MEVGGGVRVSLAVSLARQGLLQPHILLSTAYHVTHTYAAMAIHVLPEGLDACADGDGRVGGDLLREGQCTGQDLLSRNTLAHQPNLQRLVACQRLWRALAQSGGSM